MVTHQVPWQAQACRAGRGHRLAAHVHHVPQRHQRHEGHVAHRQQLARRRQRRAVAHSLLRCEGRRHRLAHVQPVEQQLAPKHSARRVALLRAERQVCARRTRTLATSAGPDQRAAPPTRSRNHQPPAARSAHNRTWNCVTKVWRSSVERTVRTPPPCPVCGATPVPAAPPAPSPWSACCSAATSSASSDRWDDECGWRARSSSSSPSWRWSRRRGCFACGCQSGGWFAVASTRRCRSCRAELSSGCVCSCLRLRAMAHAAHSFRRHLSEHAASRRAVGPRRHAPGVARVLPCGALLKQPPLGLVARRQPGRLHRLPQAQLARRHDEAGLGDQHARWRRRRGSAAALARAAPDLVLRLALPAAPFLLPLLLLLLRRRRRGCWRGCVEVP